ncbi:hypothetical protein [Nocardia thailandica]|uniref:hypothetical protein n=1 Tax=Nocardia thailandica TaxID=257275 RepID=UPI000309598B|nr:hypothetical protein [Nocardia thailandica]
MNFTDLPGSEWVSKDGKRAVVVVDMLFASKWDCELLVKGTSGSTRERRTNYSSLRSKYRRVDTPAPTMVELQARVAELEEFVTDLAGHGLRFDLNPTMQMGSVEQLYTGFAHYLVRADESIRQRAAELLSEEA